MVKTRALLWILFLLIWNAQGYAIGPNMKKELTLPDLAHRLEKELIPYKKQFVELNGFPKRVVNTPHRMEWELNETVQYSKGKHQDAGIAPMAGRIILQKIFYDPDRLPQAAGPAMDYLDYSVDTSNDALKKKIGDIIDRLINSKDSLTNR